MALPIDFHNPRCYDTRRHRHRAAARRGLSVLVKKPGGPKGPKEPRKPKGK